MSHQEPLLSVVVPQLFHCPACKTRNNRLVRVDIFVTKAEYYFYCEECERTSCVMFGVLCPEPERKDMERWL